MSDNFIYIMFLIFLILFGLVASAFYFQHKFNQTQIKMNKLIEKVFEKVLK